MKIEQQPFLPQTKVILWFIKCFQQVIVKSHVCQLTWSTVFAYGRVNNDPPIRTTWYCSYANIPTLFNNKIDILMTNQILSDGNDVYL